MKSVWDIKRIMVKSFSFSNWINGFADTMDELMKARENWFNIGCGFVKCVHVHNSWCHLFSFIIFLLKINNIRPRCAFNHRRFASKRDFTRWDLDMTQLRSKIIQIIVAYRGADRNNDSWNTVPQDENTKGKIWWNIKNGVKETGKTGNKKTYTNSKTFQLRPSNGVFIVLYEHGSKCGQRRSIIQHVKRSAYSNDHQKIRYTNATIYGRHNDANLMITTLNAFQFNGIDMAQRWHNSQILMSKETRRHKQINNKYK